ncbi:ABC transporter ATP-binding protein [Candidatus Oscillochloris fontis]|uniref:ABC transporter ATP-binding protein n=1 Tax=Candidatus Oscillochloris fontis TaxID=2496868 RepID=UPI00101D2AEF|nr:ABC transporter ATP-binding protein [Candidatus Oscillochloris fontis]
MLKINQIHKSFAGQRVLAGVSLDLAAGSILALLGPSGCGKTTLLRIVAGLEHADQGTLHLDATRIDDIPAHQRGIGMVFQDYALFPHMNVSANVAFGLRMQHLARAEITARVDEMLDLVGMTGYGQRRVFELSGGERQRVALARALAPRPRLLLLDEPLAALDRALRERLQEELGHVLRRVGVTAIYVTHDQEEAFALADLVALMHAGHLEQIGSAEAIYHQPASLWAANFLGLRNYLPGSYQGAGRIRTTLGELYGTPMHDLAPGSSAVAVVAPDAAAQGGSGSIANHLHGQIRTAQFRGRHYRVQFQVGNTAALDLDLHTPPATLGSQVEQWLNPARIFIYRSAS